MYVGVVWLHVKHFNLNILAHLRVCVLRLVLIFFLSSQERRSVGISNRLG